MDAAAELGRNSFIEQAPEMKRLTRDGTAETVSRDQILRRERGQGNIIFPWSAYIGNLTRLIHTLAKCDDHTYIDSRRSVDRF